MDSPIETRYRIICMAPCISKVLSHKASLCGQFIEGPTIKHVVRTLVKEGLSKLFY